MARAVLGCRAVPLILCIAFLLRLAWALRIPFGDAPDEARHMKTLTFFAEHGLPTREDIFSGLHGFYIASSPLPYGFNIALQALWPSAPLLAHRLIIVALGVTLVWLGYRIMRRVRPELALPFAWLLALQPQLCFQSAYVNWDMLTIVVSTLIVGTWHQIERVHAAKIGALAGLCLLCKPTGFAVLPVLLIVFLRARPSAARFLTAGASCSAVALPFLLHNNAVLPGDPFGFRTVLGTVAPDWEASVPGGWLQLFTSRWAINTFESTWAVFGHLAHKLPNPFYIAFALLTLAAALRLARHLDGPTLVAMASVASSALLAYATSAINDFQPYGRYLFPSAIPLFGIFVAGSRPWALRATYGLCVLASFVVLVL